MKYQKQYTIDFFNNYKMKHVSKISEEVKLTLPK